MKIIIFLFTFVASLTAEPLKETGYKFYKELKMSSAPKTETINYGIVKIDSDIINNSYYSDIRVVSGNKLIPFQRRIKTVSAGKKGSTTPTVIFTDDKKDSKIYVLELPSIPEGSEFTELEVRSEKPYESSVTISLGDDPKNFNESTTGSIYNYGTGSDQESGVLKFQPGKYKYARLEFSQKQNYSFPNLRYVPSVKAAESKIAIDLSKVKITQDDDLYATVYFFENEGKPFQRVEVNFGEAKFSRRYEIFEWNEKKEFVSYYTGNFYNTDKESKSQVIELPGTIKSNWKLLIYNIDDSPLTVKSFTLYQSQEELVFKLAPEDTENLQNLRIYYGNRYVGSPQFDNTWYVNNDESSQTAKFTLSEQKGNEKFAYSVFEPPVSSWIIKFLFIGGLLIIILPAYKVLKLYSEREAAVSSENKT